MTADPRIQAGRFSSRNVSASKAPNQFQLDWIAEIQ